MGERTYKGLRVCRGAEALCCGLLLFLFCFSFKCLLRWLGPGSCHHLDRENSGIDSYPWLEIFRRPVFHSPRALRCFLEWRTTAAENQAVCYVVVNGPRDP